MPTTFDPGDPVVLTPLGAWAESVASSVFGSELSVASSSPVHLPPPLALTAPPLRDQVALPAPAISQDAWVATPSRPDSPNPPLPPDLRSDQKIGP